jgi:LptD protein
MTWLATNAPCKLGAKIRRLFVVRRKNQVINGLLCISILFFGIKMSAQTTDSLPSVVDTLETSFAVSADTLEGPVDYGARDSMWIDLPNRIVHLYGEGYLNYQGFKLTAHYLKLDLKNNVAEAIAGQDTLGEKFGIPHFEQEDQVFDAQRLAYNFKTRKGLIYDVTTTQNDLYVRGTKSKFYGADPADSTTNHTVYSEDAFFTTCNDEHPHFGIRSSKQKVISGKLIVIGPSRLEIGDVPTPLYLPFGFFPITQTKRHGILTPQDVTFAADLASYGLRGLGYYIPIGEHVAIETRNDIYWNGSYNLTANVGYQKRYKYNGNFNLGFSRFLRENLETTDFEPQRSYFVRWAFNQASQAHPTIKFNANVNVQSNNYASRNRNDAGSVLNNILNSSVGVTKIFPGRPYTLSAGLNHSQNNQTRQATLNFPNLNFQMQRIFPFKRKQAVGKEKWFEKISFRYDSNLRSKIATADTALFDKKTWQGAAFGVNHSINTDASYRFLKYFSVAPSAGYKESWYFKTVNYGFTPGAETQIVFDTLLGPDDEIIDITRRTDTLAYGRIDTTYNNGLKALRLVNASVSVNTQLFGTIKLKKGPLRGLRHTIKPSASFGFAPDYGREPFYYFDSLVVIDKSGRLDTVGYTQYQIGSGLLEQVPVGGRSANLNFSLNNIFEAKVRGGRDTIDRKVKLLDNLVVNGGYNFAADSLGWRPVTASATMRLLKGLTVMSMRTSFDPYLQDSATGRTINKLVWDDTKKTSPLRFDGAEINFNTGLTVKQLREALSGKEPTIVNNNARDTSRTRVEDQLPALLDLFDNFRVSHSLSVQRTQFQGRDTTIIVNTLNFRGGVQLTENWNLDFGNIGYDFNRQKLTYPDLSLYRDLHCWEMGASWQPTRGTYTFFLRIKPGSLDFVRLPFNKAFPDRFDL